MLGLGTKYRAVRPGVVRIGVLIARWIYTIAAGPEDTNQRVVG